MIIRDQRAFTLLETIITIIIASLVGSVIIQFFGTSFLRSGDAVNSAQTYSQLTQVMENITSDFKKLSVTDANPLSTLQSNIGAEGTDMTNSYGNYRVVTNHLITFSGNPAAESTDANGKYLKVKIRSKDATLTTLFAK